MLASGGMTHRVVNTIDLLNKEDPDQTQIRLLLHKFDLVLSCLSRPFGVVTRLIIVFEIFTVRN